MLQRITALWPQLVRREADRPQQDDRGPQPLYELTDLVRRSIEQSFASLSWSRVVSLQVNDAAIGTESPFVEGAYIGIRRDWPLTEDILEAREAIVEGQMPREPEQPVLFDPKAFEGAHGELKVDNYALNADSLEQWALRAVKM